MNVSLTIAGTVAWLKLERIDRKNAITLSMWQQITELARQVSASDARVMILHGEGGCFSAGADLDELKNVDSTEKARAYWTGMKSALTAMSKVPIPTIAMIEQFCLGGGCILSLTCDLRYATKDSIFGIPVAKRGYLLDSATTTRLISLIGPARTSELIFMADTISGERACEWGLVNQVFESSQIRSEVEKIAAAICASNDLSIRQIKSQVNRTFCSIDDDRQSKEEDLLIAHGFIAKNPSQ